MRFFELLKDNKYGFIGLSVNVYDLGSHYYHKGDATMWIYDWTVSPTIKSISLCTGWLMVNNKRLYLQYEVAGIGFCD